MASEKKSYTHIVILLLMRCIRPILRELLLNLVKKGTPHGQKSWSIDDFLACHKRRIEKELPMIDKYNVYKNILYPSITQTPKTDINKWDLTLYVFILTKVCKFDQDLGYYFRQITSIREDFCKAKLPPIARDICKDYRKRLERARSRLFKQLRDDDLKKKIDRRAKRIESRQTGSAEQEEILKQWKDIEVAQLLRGEAKKTGVQKYLTIQMLLSKSCCEVMQALVFKSVKEKCPAGATEWSLDSFLSRYKSRISRRIGSLDKLGRPMDILFPKRRPTQIEDWDISLLCWVLLNVCFLAEGTADSIGEIRTIRNYIGHDKHSFSLSDSDYNSYVERIKKSIDMCLSFIGDKELSHSINDQIEDIEHTSIDKDETIRRLQVSCQNETSEREQQEKYLEVQQNILKELSRIVKKFKDIEIPDCQLELVISNCDEENENSMSKAIVKEVNGILEPEQGHSSPRRNEKFRAAVKTMLKETKAKGWPFTNATKGSVLLNIRCGSFDDLCELFNTYRGNGSDLFVSDLQSALHCTTGDDVKLHLVMYDIEIDKCVEKIVSAVMEKTNEIAPLAAEAANGHYQSPCSSKTYFAAEFPGDDLDERLLKIREVVTNKYRVSHLSSYAMTEDLNQNTVDEISAVGNTRAVVQLIPRSDVDERPPHEQLSSRMDYTASDGTAMEMETECQDVKQPINEPVENKADTKLLFKVEETDTSSTGDSPYVDRQHSIEEAFKGELICLYEKANIRLADDILGHELDCCLDQCYVEPQLVNLCSMENIYDLKQNTLTKEASRIETLEDVFFHHTKPLKNIYIIADAGIGKTAFAKRLAMTWCKANAFHITGQKLEKSDLETMTKTGQKLKKNDLETMTKFEFLFILPLREAGVPVCEMESLIHEHVVKRLPKSNCYPKTFIAELLQRETTLVVLDGLDEWSHSQKCEKQGDVPHRTETFHCTILTTSRPWKLSAIAPHVAVDKIIRISTLDENTYAQLASNLISFLNSKEKRRVKLKLYQDFEENVSLEKIGDIRFVPYILLKLVCLWYNDKPLGRSLFEILSNTVALKVGLEKRNLLKGDNLDETILRRPTLERSICLLGKLAFDGLFCCENTPALVFDKSVIDEGIFNASLEMGILCKTNEMSVSFQHKTLQEYFAALYTCENEQTIEKIAQSCSSITSVLDKQNVILFIAHTNPSTADKIWQILQRAVSNSDSVANYRSRITLNREDISKFELLKEVQVMFVAVLKVSARTFQLEDVIIDDISNAVQILDLMRAIESDGNSIKSLHVKSVPRADMLAVLKLFGNTRTLQKLSITGSDYLCLVQKVMSQSVDTLRSVSLESSLDLDFTGHFESISSEMLHVLLKTRQLESLRLRHWQFTVEQVRFLSEVLTAKTKMKQLLLDGLDCQTCDSFQLDLFHDQLQDLVICNTHVTQLRADVSSLRYCCFGGLSPGVEASVLAMLKRAKHLRTLILRDITSICRTSDGLEDTLTNLFKITKRLKHLSCIIFDFVDLTLDQQICEDLSMFIDRVQKIRRPVTVILKISKCTGDCFCHSLKNFNTFQRVVSVCHG